MCPNRTVRRTLLFPISHPLAASPSVRSESAFFLFPYYILSVSIFFTDVHFFKKRAIIKYHFKYFAEVYASEPDLSVTVSHN